jgi:hypothetical protein
MIHVAALLLSLPWTGAAAAEGVEPRGAYVEARTAAVFAGACHFGGQATTQGRGALLAWHFDGGSHHGVELAGVDVVAVLSAGENLADAAAKRRSWIYVSNADGSAARDAAVDWLRANRSELFGSVQSVRAVSLALAIEGERYSVRSDAGFALEGATLLDRACCRMPFNVWYRPFVALDQPIVGHNDEFRVSDRAVDERWSRPDENAAFVGAFGERAAARGGERAAARGKD